MTSGEPAGADETRLYEIWGEIADLEAATELLEWDQETFMPAAGQEGRGKLLGTVAALIHRRLTSPELADVLARCAERARPGSLLAAQVARARHAVGRAVRVPESLSRAIAEAASAGVVAWKRAREAADFELFAPALRRLLDLRRQQAAAIGDGGPPYDAMLDGYEPGATEAQLTPLFDQLRRTLTPRVRAVVESGKTIDESPACGHFPAAAQEAFVRRVAAGIGFRFEAGRLDPATHPFCVGLNPGDVRLTWRLVEDDFRPALFGVLHEAGHGLYEQGLPAASSRTPIGAIASLGLHESQSRLWENHVGRSLGFWRWVLPTFRDHFPAAPRFTAAELWPALHTVKPSLIRVDADETTYNLHVVVRFELERALFAGELEVGDLPAAWDDLYQELLGIRPENVADGVLQDIHWSQGMFGYFPTYTLGTVIAAQLIAAAERQLGHLEELLAAGEASQLLGWLRRHVHRHGSRFEAAELVVRATGKPLAADDLLRYLDETIERAYGA
ncbi:MAG: carboxypeptidase M32 [Acidobacteria bacterium]|nr:MAG: carboxypeptidase M32 [Acidobacteriota bacterium]